MKMADLSAAAPTSDMSGIQQSGNYFIIDSEQLMSNPYLENYIAAQRDSERKMLFSDKLKMARNNVCENYLHRAEQQIDRERQEKLQCLQIQSLKLQHNIRVHDFEKQQNKLEIKKRFNPNQNFSYDEMQLENARKRLGLVEENLYLRKHLRHPIRLSIVGQEIPSSMSKARGALQKMESLAAKLKKRNTNKESKPTDSKNQFNHDVSQVTTLPKINTIKTSGEKDFRSCLKFSIFPNTNRNKNDDDFKQVQQLNSDKITDEKTANKEAKIEEHLRMSNFLERMAQLGKIPNSKIPSLQNSVALPPRAIQNLAYPMIQELLEQERMIIHEKIRKYFDTVEVKRSVEEEESSDKNLRQSSAASSVSTKTRSPVKSWRLTKPPKQSYIENIALALMAGIQRNTLSQKPTMPLNTARRALQRTPTFQIRKIIQDMIKKSATGNRYTETQP